jgi:hypothetical protein
MIFVMGNLCPSGLRDVTLSAARFVSGRHQELSDLLEQWRAGRKEAPIDLT